jgi:hypothetical protein
MRLEVFLPPPVEVELPTEVPGTPAERLDPPPPPDEAAIASDPLACEPDQPTPRVGAMPPALPGPHCLPASQST